MIPYEKSERRNARCYAQAKFYIKSVLRHKSQLVALQCANICWLAASPSNNPFDLLLPLDYPDDEHGHIVVLLGAGYKSIGCLHQERKRVRSRKPEARPC